jgi:purine-nucleoside phosphorylase
MRRRFSQVLEIGSPNGLLDDVFLGTLDGIRVGYASVYGAPMASEVTHLFGVLGARLVIQIGTCGGFGNGMRMGDLFVAEEAYCGEGASQYYKTDGKTVGATIKFSDAADVNRHGARIARGRIYTTSALFAESRADIDRWAGLGFSAVDLETGAPGAGGGGVGKVRGGRRAVYDNPRGEDHILSADVEKSRRRRAAQKAMVEIALESILQYAKKRIN